MILTAILHRVNTQDTGGNINLVKIMSKIISATVTITRTKYVPVRR